MKSLTSNKFLYAASTMTFVAAIAYLMITNAVAGKGYEIKQLERGIRDAKRDIEQLQYKTALELSSTKLAEKSAALGLVSPESIKYLVQGGGVVAMR